MKARSRLVSTIQRGFACLALTAISACSTISYDGVRLASPKQIGFEPQVAASLKPMDMSDSMLELSFKSDEYFPASATGAYPKLYACDVVSEEGVIWVSEVYYQSMSVDEHKKTREASPYRYQVYIPRPKTNKNLCFSLKRGFWAPYGGSTNTIVVPKEDLAKAIQP